LAWWVLSAAVLNFVLIGLGFTYGLNHYGEIWAVFGAGGATILSRVLYLGLILERININLIIF